jgi:hypothetical protein
MEPLSIALSYVSLKFVDQFLKEEGYGRFKKFIFPEKKYRNKLAEIFYETIEEYRTLYPKRQNDTKFYFFQSQILFEELNKYVLFETEIPDYKEIIERFNEFPNIIIPSSEELKYFYELFVSKINVDKKLKSLFVDENYKIKIFELSDKLLLIETKIDDINAKVISIESALIFNPDDSWFNNQCKLSIVDLGKRYTPELNFELKISKIFDGLGRTQYFIKSFDKQIDELLIKGKKNLKGKEETKEDVQLLEKKFDELFNLYSQLGFESNIKIPFKEIDSILDSIDSSIKNIGRFYREEERKIQEEKKERDYYHKYGTELSNIRDFERSINDFKFFINDTICDLVNNPYLILEGEAGIGKSHMLGDIISKRIESDYESVFLLGQHFTSDEAPWIQIFKRLQIDSTSDNFLNIVNDRAKKSNKRIIIFIDAINEGRGKYFWNDNVKSFINEIKKYKYLGLVLSIRSSYKQLILPKDELNALDIIDYKLSGFRNNEYDACKLFFSNYKIQLPNVPLLHPEFQNPLFLKLFCEGIHKSGQNKIPDGIQGISVIINFFIKNVNDILSKPKRFDYSNGINLVDKSISAIIRYKIDTDVRYIPYEKGIEIVEEIVSRFVTKKGTFLDELISEGVFSKNLFWKDKDVYEEGIYLAYERFEDHLLCKYLLETHLNLDSEFKDGGNLFKYIKEENDLYFNKGLIDAFSIQIPEKTSKEFYEYIPHLKDSYTVADSFVESLLWRKIETINESSKNYVNEVIFSYEETSDKFWETILAITSVPKHYYNAYSLHDHLMKFSMADRDEDWTQILKDKYDNDSSVKRLIDWAWNEDDKAHISDESVKLSSIALNWFHTSTNRELRDSSTKALVSLLQNRIDVLIEVLKTFENVNDPSVYERLFAVAYGCALRTNQKEKLTDLSEYIFETIFKDKEEIYPHVLLRDYARGVIEFTNYLGLDGVFRMELIRPPYKSKFSKRDLSNECIDERYSLDYNSKDFKKYYWSQNTILNSMTTEYGRGTGGYGDFGRYTFQSALSSWDVNPNKLSNLAIEWIFKKYGYDVEKHGVYDNNLDYKGRSASTIERIGKKYQWLALYEMVARVSDNFPKFERWSFSDENEEPYKGPWSPYIRDIDPTILIKKTGSYNEDEELDFWWSDKSSFNWDCSDEDWVKKTDNLPKIESLIQVCDSENEEWLLLEGYPEWAEPKKIGEEKWDSAHKRLWCHIRSYIIKEEEFDKFQNWLTKQSFMGRWMPESIERYEIFNREYYWSPAYRCFNGEDSEEGIERDISDNETGKFITSATIPIESYRWEEEFDKSKEETLGFMKPSLNIFQGMKLQYSNREGEFVNSSNELICFDTSVHHNSKSYFLIKKKPFLEYLHENKLKVVWTILGEKQIIGGRTFREDYIGMLEFSGAYYFTENIITGTLNTKER